MSTQSARYSPIISKIYRSRNILLNILKDKRGFDVSDYTDFSINEIMAMWKNKQMDMLLENPTSGRKIFIKYHLDTKIKSNYIYEYVDDLFDVETILSKEDELIIITKDKINDGLRALIQQIYINDHKFINIYNLNNYLFNILKHSLVPEHNMLSDADKARIVKKYYITNDKQFPEISRFDPVAQAIGLRPGQLVEIIRSSPTAITTKYYRLCR